MIEELEYLELCYLPPKIAAALSKDISITVMGYQQIAPNHSYLWLAVSHWYVSESSMFNFSLTRRKKLRKIKTAWQHHIKDVSKLERVLLNWPEEYLKL